MLPGQGAHQPGLGSKALFYTETELQEVLMNVLEESELGRSDVTGAQLSLFLSLLR